MLSTARLSAILPAILIISTTLFTTITEIFASEILTDIHREFPTARLLSKMLAIMYSQIILGIIVGKPLTEKIVSRSHDFLSPSVKFIQRGYQFLA